MSATTNRITGSPYTYDANGNMTNDGNSSLVYDEFVGERTSVGCSLCPSYGGNQPQTRISLHRVGIILGIQYPHGSWLFTIPSPKSPAQLGAVGPKL